ncbi:MAG: 6-bladed beta-propeller [Acidobacteria bacterium]|nr:6-bladed beta-propeller [Acidobacteriota bacterium]MCB9398517.1 6-bladed beta-propeller [Acidobacteriota bacterium]
MLLVFFCVLAEWKNYETEVFRPLTRQEVTVVGERIYAIQADQCQILVFDKNGQKIKAFGGKGQGPGEMMVPLSLFGDAQYLYVIDPQMGVIHKFDLDGTFVSRLNLPGREADYIRVQGGWAFGDWVFSLDPEKPIEFQFSDDSFANPKTIVSWPREKMAAGMMILEDGSGSIPKIPYNPAMDRVRWTVSPDGTRVAISSGHSFQVALYSFPEAKPLSDLKADVPAVPFNSDWGDEQFAGVKERNKRMADMMEPKYPDTFPAVREVTFLPDGLLAVELWTGRPELDRKFLYFDAQGKAVEPGYSRELVTRWFGRIGDQDLVFMWDEKEEVAGLASVPHAKTAKFVEASPIHYDGPGRMINISIGD